MQKAETAFSTYICEKRLLETGAHINSGRHCNIVVYAVAVICREWLKRQMISSRTH